MGSRKKILPQRPSKTTRASQNGFATQTPSEASTSAARVTADDFTNLVNNTVYYILVADQHKRAIKKQDITKHVLKDSPYSFGEILKEARRKLTHVFGYELVDVKEKAGSYMLISNVDLKEASQFMKKSETEYAKQGIVTLILSLIMMMGGSLLEETLWEILASMGVKLDMPDAVFGNVKRWVTTDLVKQMYLDYSKVEGSELVTYQLKWGPRATREVPKMDLLDFVCEVHGDGMQPEHWISVFSEISDTTQSQR